jgi:hypothetical protein
MAARTARPPKASRVLKSEAATAMRYPMPALAATVSEITEPTNAEETATFSEAKNRGIVRGTPTLRKICQREAPSERSTSRSSVSRVASPTATLTATGKNASRKAVSTAGTVPMPNHMTSRGTTAALGMLLNPTRSG